VGVGWRARGKRRGLAGPRTHRLGRSATHSALTSPALGLLPMRLGVLPMQLMRGSARALSAMVEALSQLEELQAESMVHSACAWGLVRVPVRQ
jgi:hypothetical protein